jgi:glycosyltransferase involved in cell wall biosynthesis
VIPTRGRESRLAFGLESLLGQLEPERFEVLVVRDADAPEPFAAGPPGLRLRNLVLDRSAGPTAKRNLGWRSTSAPLVAFTDDDCRAEPGWLEALLAAAGGPSVFLQGKTVPDPDERHLLHGLARTVEVTSPTGWYETCNMAYPRELLERLGGFDEAFDFGGEDTDLGWRAVEAGAEARFVAEAVVRHAVVTRSLPSALAEATRWPDTAAVVARHPQLHESLHHRHFWNREHMTLALAIAGLAVARRAPALAAAAALPYVGMHVNWRRPRPRRIARGLATLPLFALVDGAEMAGRLPSAIRNRVAVI